MVINSLLLIISILIYASFGVQNLFFILFSIISAFFAGKYINNGKHKKCAFILTLFFNIFILVLFKMLPYTKASIISPLGVSYYTLQIVSYLVDVYKGNYEPEKNFLNFALYIAYIPP